MGDVVQWRSIVDKADFLEAIGFVRTRAGLRYKGPRLEPDVVIMVAPDGLSFRTANLACDIPASGSWPSPIVAHGPTLRRLAPKLSGPTIALHYSDGALTLNQTTITAREIDAAHPGK